MEKRLVAQVWLPRPLPPFNYLVPPDLYVKEGMRVIVPFQKQGRSVGIIAHLEEKSIPPDAYKKVLQTMDRYPLLLPYQIPFFEWIASYYFCHIGDVLRAALPSSFYLQKKKLYRFIPNNAINQLPKILYPLLTHLIQHETITEKQLVKLLPEKGKEKWKSYLLHLQLLEPITLFQDRYKEKTILCVTLSNINLDQAFSLVAKAPAQERLLLKIIELSQKRRQPIPVHQLLTDTNASYASLQALIEKGIIQKVYLPQSRLSQFLSHQPTKQIQLTPAQLQALHSLQNKIQQNPVKPLLFHGITGSGKTYIYIELMKTFIQQKKQILYLLPEIALTQQVIDKVKTAFGDKVGVYHSRLSPEERAEVWMKTLNGTFQIIIGVRSALFLPFPHLSLIIVDEEHDPSFKQSEQAPRYQARDSAIYLAHLLQIPIVLGSATPSLESYYNSRIQKYNLVELMKRPFPVQLPTIQLVDMRHEVKNRLSYGLFSSVLIQHLQDQLKNGKQSILFRNRRGYAPYVQCQSCGFVFMCPHCDLTLTYHKAQNQLACHYCQYHHPYLPICPQCQNSSLHPTGIGTERIEEHLKELFPQARIARMDLDTTHSKYAHQRLIRELEHRQIDILIGTQMVTKGLDFENVTLVGVLDADKLLYYPSFRAYEHAYHLLIQFRGRAARSQTPGKMIIQSFTPNNPFFQFLDQPFSDFFDALLPAREKHQYPPFYRLIELELQSPDPDYVEQVAKDLATPLQEAFGNSILGPSVPSVQRLRNRYRRLFLLKWKRSASSDVIKQKLAQILQKALPKKRSTHLRIIVNVDP